jgi:thioredoxin-related protein
MKKIIPALITIFLLSVSSLELKAQSQAPQASIQWVSLEEALKLNEKKPKKFFLDMYTDWCGWCKRMDQTTFVNPVIADYMNETYYPVKFNAERKDTVVFKGKTFINPNPASSRSAHQLAAYLLQNRLSYPSFVFLSEGGDLITILPGYRKAPELEAILHFIGGNAYKDTSFEEFSATFQGKATE